MTWAVRIVTLLALLGGAYLYWVWPQPPRPALGEAALTEYHGGVSRSYALGPRISERIVMLASLGRSVSDFNEYASALADEGYRILLVEFPGIRDSNQNAPLEDITLFSLADGIDAALIADGAQEDEPLVLVGHAFGNRWARAYATLHPSRVQKIILLAAGGSQRIGDDPKTLTSMRKSFEWWRPPPRRRAAVKYAFFADQNDVPDYWLHGWNRDAADIAIAAVRNTPVKEWRAAGGIAPILIVQAHEDRIAPPGTTSGPLQRDFPDRISVATVSPSGHAMLPEVPHDILSLTLAFIEN